MFTSGGDADDDVLDGEVADLQRHVQGDVSATARVEAAAHCGVKPASSALSSYVPGGSAGTRTDRRRPSRPSARGRWRCLCGHARRRAGRPVRVRTTPLIVPVVCAAAAGTNGGERTTSRKRLRQGEEFLGREHQAGLHGLPTGARPSSSLAAGAWPASADRASSAAERHHVPKGSFSAAASSSRRLPVAPGHLALAGRTAARVRVPPDGARVSRAFCLLVALLMWALTALAWPAHLERTPPGV